MKNLRDYIELNLPNPLEADILGSFFKRPDIIDQMAEIEQIVDEILAKWPQVQTSTVPAMEQGALVSVEVSVKDLPKIESKEATEQEVIDKQTASDIILEQPNVIEPISLSEAIVSPVQNPDSLKFNPTQQAELSSSQLTRSILIPNAMVGKAYSYLFDFEALGLADVTEHTLIVDEATGLIYDNETQTLNGKPISSGEFKLVLNYRIKTTESNRPTLTRTVQLLINPDPRSLWKDLPSDKNDPYYKPDSDQDFLSIGDIRLMAASVRGRSHAHEGKFRDDDFNLAYLAETGWYILAVADGAGSAPYARRGAQLACLTVMEHLKTAVAPTSWEALNTAVDQYSANLQEEDSNAVQRQLYDVLGKAVFAAYKAIEIEAQPIKAVAKDFATTLITVLAKPVVSGWFVGAFWVGDGGVGIYRFNNDPIILGTPDGGEYAGQTRFLTMSETISNNFFGRFRVAFVPDITAIILMTDGVTDPKFQTDNNLNRKEKWDELWTDLTQTVSFNDDQHASTQLEEWLTFWSPGNHDDRTIALLYLNANNDTN